MQLVCVLVNSRTGLIDRCLKLACAEVEGGHSRAVIDGLSTSSNCWVTMALTIPLFLILQVTLKQHEVLRMAVT